MNSINQMNVILDKAGITPTLKPKWEALLNQLGRYQGAVIAYSGGVDSSFLAFAASLVLGEKMTAVTVVSPVEPARILDGARQFAVQHGFKHETIKHNPLQNPGYQANSPDRCYYCKTIILGDLWEYARNNHYQVVLEGQNADDTHDYRPGRKAVAETGTFSPLAENGLSKTEIRWLAKAMNLSIWDQPSSPCLSSRIPYGTPITEEALEQIARGEDFLHDKGFRVVRVRYHQNLARIEVEPGQIQALLDMREDLLAAFKQIGFLYTTIDLQGYRLGSLNEGLGH